MQNFFKKDEASTEPRSFSSVSKRSFRSEELFGSDREIVIIHGEQQYRLQITKAGKLILNK